MLSFSIASSHPRTFREEPKNIGSPFERIDTRSHSDLLLSKVKKTLTLESKAVMMKPVSKNRIF